MFLQKSRGQRGDEGHIWQKKGGVRETSGNHPLVRVAGGGRAEAGHGLLLFWFLATSCLSSTHLLVWSVRCSNATSQKMTANLKPRAGCKVFLKQTQPQKTHVHAQCPQLSAARDTGVRGTSPPGGSQGFVCAQRWSHHMAPFSHADLELRPEETASPAGTCSITTPEGQATPTVPRLLEKCREPWDGQRSAQTSSTSFKPVNPLGAAFLDPSGLHSGGY